MRLTRLTIDQLFEQTVAVVEATFAEKHFLWSDWAKDSFGPKFEKRLQWEDFGMGSMPTLGSLDNMPVTMCIFWARIEGRIVLFWEQISVVTDTRKVMKFLKKNLKHLDFDRANFDAANFGQLVNYIEEMNNGN